MRTRDLLILLVCALVAAASLFAAGSQLDFINGQREKMKLTINPALENAPPSLAFATVAMGAFRGLIVDILWMRADKLKEEGQFFDALQLAKWITTLQPRFGAVWEFHAWNMAYNISVTIPATQPEQRWRWVKNGYELLRDEGIPLNPKSIRLYRELGRIFQHKLGGISDDAHEYYKLQFAEEIGPLLDSADNGLGANDNKYLEALIAAPKEWSKIRSDPNLASFLQALQAADEGFVSEATFVSSYLSLRQNPSRFKLAAGEVIEAYRDTIALRKFDLFAKAYQLRHVWKMDPALMLRVGLLHGPVDYSDSNVRLPMDWRHPDSHAIYWAVKALDVAIQEKDREISTHEANTDMIVLHSLQNLFRYGRIVITQRPPDPNTGAPGGRDLFVSPDLRFFDSYNRTTLAVLDKYTDDRGRLEARRNGHRNMLKNAALSFYQAGLRAKAENILEQLRAGYPDYPEFQVPLDEFAMNRIREELESIGVHDATEQIMTLLVNAYRLLALHDDNGAAGNEQLAEGVWQMYYKEFGDTDRIALPAMERLRYLALGQFLQSNAYPLYIREALWERIQREQPDLVRQLEQAAKQLQQELEQQQKTKTGK
ncbi:MAG TPA: hypothetical protein PKH24_07495 [Sedimentisphaerales bacterium]|jgi:hypothetical protein|nr:hypothetical protein [Sedimentisphaerales bacterium]HNU31534.1 hypothetical protein [Sedimentisphaerales bacterium]